jgi:hypothetical protein
VEQPTNYELVINLKSREDPWDNDPAVGVRASRPGDGVVHARPTRPTPACALGFAGCSLPSYDRALWALRTWLDSWTGIGHVAVGMHRQGFDLQLTQYDDRGCGDLLMNMPCGSSSCCSRRSGLFFLAGLCGVVSLTV